MCAFGVVFDLDIGIRYDRIARIGYNAGKPTTGRGLGDQYIRDRHHKQEAQKNQEHGPATERLACKMVGGGHCEGMVGPLGWEINKAGKGQQEKALSARI